jgi:hypothetical protein
MYRRWRYLEHVEESCFSCVVETKEEKFGMLVEKTE